MNVFRKMQCTLFFSSNFLWQRKRLSFQALYTDPNTKLRYANSDEYQQIQHLSSDAVIGLLALRRANY